MLTPTRVFSSSRGVGKTNERANEAGNDCKKQSQTQGFASLISFASLIRPSKTDDFGDPRHPRC